VSIVASANSRGAIEKTMMPNQYFCVLYAILLVPSFQPYVAAQQAEIVVPVVSGVYVDAAGVLQTVMVGDPGDQLSNLRRGVPTARATGAVASKTGLRRVSLARLAREVQGHIEAGTAIPDEAHYLAGIQQIQYLFVYPEEQDLVIAGPADGWQVDESGRVVGQHTRRPVVRLDDLVVALRVFAPRSRRNTFVGCSIDQTEEGMRRFPLRRACPYQSGVRGVAERFRPHRPLRPH
jgi:hypothetical protein